MGDPDAYGGASRPRDAADYAAELGLTLLRHRLSGGLSLRAVAGRLRMSGHGGLGEYEKGRRIPPEDLLSAWTRALGLPPGEAGELGLLHAKALAQRAARKSQELRGSGQLGTGTAQPEIAPAHLGSDYPLASLRAAQLPPDIGDFTGRHRELGRLQELAGQAGGTAGPVAVIWGEPGIGKTALATRFSHEAAAGFPDAQIYVNLRGVHDPVEPSRALSGVLRSLGVADSVIPSGLDERAALYRSVLASVRALVLLDDAASEAQVRPLLPGGPRCLTIVTSRAAMSGLAGALRMRLPAFSAGEADELLARIVGADRVDDNPQSCERLVQLCGCLPLAVRIAANRLANWPDWPPEFLGDLLQDERARLAELSCGDLECRSAFLASYQALDADMRWLFRCLGHVPGADFAPDVVAALTTRPSLAAGTALEYLAGAGLLQAAPDAGRYRLHDLLRIFALERSRLEDDEATRRGAVRRMACWLLHTAGAAGTRLAPPSEVQDASDDSFAGGRHAALAWLDAEWPAVLGAARLAGDLGLAAEVFGALRGTLWYFDLRYRWEPLAELAATACDLACRQDLPGQQVRALNGLGLARFGLQQYQAAARTHGRALAVAQRTGDADGETTAWDLLGLALSGLERFTEASNAHLRAARLARSMGDPRSEASALNHLGATMRMRGLFARAAKCHRRSMRLLAGAGDAHGAAMARNELGFALTELGSLPKAQDCHEQAAAALAATADEWGEAWARLGLGQVLARLGCGLGAIEQLEHARRVLSEVGDQDRAQAASRALSRLRQPT